MGEWAKWALAIGAILGALVFIGLALFATDRDDTGVGGPRPPEPR
jgi:hypothetical protein